MYRIVAAALILLSMVALSAAPINAGPLNQAPRGFTSLFDGHDLAGWCGRQQDYSPYAEAKLTPDELAAKQAAWNADLNLHWHVRQEMDTIVPDPSPLPFSSGLHGQVKKGGGEIVSDGHGVYLTTDKNYGDFELYIDWMMVHHNGDSGIYLRTYPQVQIWDPSNPAEVGNGAPRGSGALWNDNNDNPGKWPLVKADHRVGEWNTFHIKMIGSRVWVWLNGKQTVDGQVLDNYFDRSLPVLARGPIELQTHGSEIRFRNIYIREIPAAEANATLDKLNDKGFQSIFDGKDFAGWGGDITQYEVKDGAIVCLKGKGGNVFTLKQYSDFEARLEFKLPPAGNNGLCIRYPGSGDTAYVGMCELQILDDSSPEYLHLDPRQFCCSIYGVVPAHRGYLRPVGEWNYEHVIVKGHTIKVELNGTTVVDADVSTVTSFMANSKHPGLMRTSGSFGFAGHDDPVAFRDIRIKELK